MQDYQSRQVSNGWPNQVLVEERTRVEEIESYLANVIEELTSFIHVFYDGIDLQSTYDLLDQHLPDGPIAGQKNIRSKMISNCKTFAEQKKDYFL